MLYNIKKIKMLFLNIPKDIDIKIGKNWIKFVGPLGQVIKKKSKDIKLYFSKTQQKLYLLNKDNKNNHFYLSMINNIIWGISKGYLSKLQIIGVGYKAQVDKDNLILRLGYSHEVYYKIPKNIKITVLQQKILTLVVFGNNYQQVKQTAAEIRSLKSPEPYKGKGIRFLNEIVKQKEGKKN